MRLLRHLKKARLEELLTTTEANDGSRYYTEATGLEVSSDRMESQVGVRKLPNSEKLIRSIKLWPKSWSREKICLIHVE